MEQWKAAFDKGVACYRRGDFEDALVHMNQAADLQSEAFLIYDSRAAVHEKLGNIKSALLDSKRVIDLAPDRWQGYVRSARLFELLGKHGSVIKMVDHALSHLRQEDVQRRAQLSELRERAVAARADELSSQSSYYLFGKLPVETLVGIFTMLIDEDHTWAIRLSHVCGHWRQILICTPSTWRTLVLSKRHPLQKVKLWKERSRNSIGRISLDISEIHKPSVFAELKSLSWDRLSSLRMSFVDVRRMLSTISIPHAFSGLDELDLFDCDMSSQLSCDLNGPSWKLKTLRMSGCTYMREWWQKLRQLKELHLCGMVFDFYIAIFAANPFLETFVIDYHADPVDRAEYNGVPPLCMNNLKHVEFQNSTDPFPIARTITTPSITHFRMSNTSLYADETLLHIASRPSLIELHISRCSLDSSTLSTLLSSTPSLETLRITHIHAVINEVFQFLSTGMTDVSYDLPCRALKHVDVSQCSDLTTSDLYAFVKARVRNASELPESAEKCAIIESLNVDGCPNIEGDMLPWFRSKVARFSCVYATKKDFKKDRGRRLQL